MKEIKNNGDGVILGEFNVGIPAIEQKRLDDATVTKSIFVTDTGETVEETVITAAPPLGSRTPKKANPIRHD